jgi:glycosyltransferase EpsJ
VYFINPASVTRNYLKNYPEVFRNSLEQKKRLVMHYHIGGIDGWELHTCWAGLLIAVGNEFAPGNPAGLFSKTQESVRIMQRPGFS